MLTGALVVLRHAEAADLDALIRGLNDVRARGDHVPTAFQSPVRLRRSFSEHGFATEAVETLLVTRATDGALIGTVGHAATHPSFSEREIGYGIFDEADRRRGYASEAVGLLIDHLFSSREQNRLRAHIHPRNEASARVVAKLGFTREGTIRDVMLVGGRYVDQEVWGLLRGEWLARRPAPDL